MTSRPNRDRLILGWFGDNTDRIVWQAANVNP
jgi:hypothetical protein